MRSTWYFLAILVLLMAAYRGLLILRREGTTGHLARQIFGVRVDAGEPYSAMKLSEIRTEIGDRVKRRWWRAGRLNKRRWQELEDLIDARMKEAMDNLMRTILGEIRSLEGDDAAERKERFASLEGRVWNHLESGELNAAQHGLLLKVIQEMPRRATS